MYSLHFILRLWWLNGLFYVYINKVTNFIHTCKGFLLNMTCLVERVKYECKVNFCYASSLWRGLLVVELIQPESGMITLLQKDEGDILPLIYDCLVYIKFVSSFAEGYWDHCIERFERCSKREKRQWSKRIWNPSQWIDKKSFEVKILYVSMCWCYDSYYFHRSFEVDLKIKGFFRLLTLVVN